VRDKDLGPRLRDSPIGCGERAGDTAPAAAAPARLAASPGFTITADTDGGDHDNVSDALLFRLPLDWRNGAVTCAP
jgi:hypothetical protein